jgi:ABC-type Fe3+/spermidine/putrescine transport system ATPase subunit/ABC-type sulfate transport system permease component
VTQGSSRPLRALALLLAVYLCAPFIAGLPQIGRADWAGVDWHTLIAATTTSVASASVAALLILIGGVPLGYWLARSSSRAMNVLGFVVQLPLALPPLASGVLLLFLLGPYSELGRLFNGALTDSFVGIVCAETFVAAPFLIVAARSAFAAADPLLEDVAATLGHGARARFFRVALPVARPALGAGLALAWLRAFGEFGATVMVAYHPYSLPVYSYVQFGGQGLPAMMPLLLPMLAIAAACAFLTAWRGARSPMPTPRPTGVDEPAFAAHESAARPEPVPDLAVDLKKSLGDFSLEIAWAPAARRLAIIGPSGSGKSLALRLIAGLVKNEAGRVSLGGAELGDLPPERRQIGYMPQDYGLFPHMTVAQQLAFPVDADAASARYWTAHLGLAPLLGRLPHQLSLGQCQRVALARALTRHSHLLLFDEPFSALDTPRRRRLQRALRELQREIAAVTVIVTHDPDEAALLADEVLVIDHGRVLQTGPVDAVFAQPADMRVAELLGLRNLGQGIVSGARQITTEQGLTLEFSGDATSWVVGQPVMWRVASHALRFVTPMDLDADVDADARSAHGIAARVAAVEWRDGERYARVLAGGSSFDVALDGQIVEEGTEGTLQIERAGVLAWPAVARKP